MRYRRSPGLVTYWEASRLVCFDCRSGRRFAIDPDTVRVLDAMEGWTTSRALAARLGAFANGVDVSSTVRGLARLGLVEQSGDATADWPWQPWMPEAAFFHFGTRSERYPADPRDQDVELRAKARTNPAPPPAKSVRGRRVRLPPPMEIGEFSQVLRARRTWRNFARTPVPLASLATLLQLTWGVQHVAMVKGQGTVVLKTSPSGGARHPIEAYVLAPRIDGLRPRAYHYDPVRHVLVDLDRDVSPALVERLLGHQDYYRGAAAIVVMTAVIARSMWKYPRSRAYRTVLADAGHLGQTFCLTATALGLAPFCTMAFQDAAVERLLRIDGVCECAMYVVGVGARAPGHAARPGRISPKRG